MTFLPSWNESLMALLPKKGNIALMKNYRPVSLVNRYKNLHKNFKRSHHESIV
ncbi:hypothetical protein BY458DRAFT_527398 [Sporodiniella umbellata]|nr:hypothetical protein BY458DRAFT_527398 [Sporodiniella umbellata]